MGGRAQEVQLVGAEAQQVARRQVEVQVEGLVIPAKGDINPVATFGATLSCLTPHGVMNVSTGQFPASAAGDARIEDTVSVPHPCMDPILFVVGPAGQWFAMSNAEDEGE